MRGPCVVTGAASTDATTCTACGLPIDNTDTSTATPSTSSDSTGVPCPSRNGTSAARSRGGPMSTVTWPSSSSLGTMSPFFVSTRNSRLVVSPWSAREHDEAARAVAAMLDFVAVGVEDAVAEVGVALRGLDDQHLVAADAEVTVRECAHLLLREFDVLAHAVEHDEVVAQPLHFREAQRHGRGECRRAR